MVFAGPFLLQKYPITKYIKSKETEMVEITNVRVYELEESIIACRNAMRTEPVSPLHYNLGGTPIYEQDEWDASLKRAQSLAKNPSNSGHPNFLTGIRVAFDIKYPNYFSPELRRYHWVDIVTSSSKMHKLAGIVAKASFNKYVLPETIEMVQKLADNFIVSPTYDNRIILLSNCPQGIELFMRVNTNYMQLRNIYHQRKAHRLTEDWGAFCDMIKGLPLFEDFINK